MTESKSRSLTLANDPVARLREMHDLDAPAPAPQERRNVEAPERVTASAPQRNTGATENRGVVEAQPRVDEPPLPRCDEIPNVHRNASTTKRTGVGVSQRSNEGTGDRSGAEIDARERAQSEQRTDEASQHRSPEPTCDPVREAMQAALRRPYPADDENGPSTSSTIRMPTEIWERLDMAARLEGMTKQAIIAQALRHHLAKIGRSGR